MYDLFLLICLISVSVSAWNIKKRLLKCLSGMGIRLGPPTKIPTEVLPSDLNACVFS